MFRSMVGLMDLEHFNLLSEAINFTTALAAAAASAIADFNLLSEAINFTT